VPFPRPGCELVSAGLTSGAYACQPLIVAEAVGMSDVLIRHEERGRLHSGPRAREPTESWANSPTTRFWGLCAALWTPDRCRTAS